MINCIDLYKQAFKGRKEEVIANWSKRYFPLVHWGYVLLNCTGLYKQALMGRKEEAIANWSKRYFPLVHSAFDNHTISHQTCR